MTSNILDLNKNNFCVFMYYVRICITFGVTHVSCSFGRYHWNKFLLHTGQVQQLRHNKENPEDALGGLGV